MESSRGYQQDSFIRVFCLVNCVVPLLVLLFLGVCEGTSDILCNILFEGNHEAWSLVFLFLRQACESAFEAAAASTYCLSDTFWSNWAPLFRNVLVITLPPRLGERLRVEGSQQFLWLGIVHRSSLFALIFVELVAFRFAKILLITRGLHLDKRRLQWLRTRFGFAES